MTDFEAWEAHYDFHERQDYPGLVAYCENEVRRDPDDLHAAERLSEAYLLNRDYEKAINFAGAIHHDCPDISAFQDFILDALFALGKTENDFQWSERPTVMRIGPEAAEICYDFVRPKRKPRALYELRLELEKRAYVAFTADELLTYLQQDSRFVIDGSNTSDAAVSAQRKTKRRATRGPL